MAALSELVDFFPDAYKTEIISILNAIDNERIATTIEELSSLMPETLGESIRNNTPPIDDFLSDMYFTTISGRGESKVEHVFSDYIIGDINEPTTRLAQERVNNVWQYFMNLFDGSRQKVMNVIISNFRDNVEFANPSHPFEQFATLDERTFISSLPDTFYTAYATYLIDAANRYLQVNRRDFQAFGKILNSITSKPIKNAKITAVTTAGISFSGITYSNFDGHFSLSFTSQSKLSSSKNIQIKVEKEGYSELRGTIEYDPSDKYKITVVNLIELAISTSATILAIKTRLGLNIPAGLVNYFTQKDITTLEDIRKVGLLRNRKDLSISPTNAVLKQLDSLSLLELVDLDFEKNNDFISAGYNSFVDIASTPRSKFIESHSSILGNDYETLKYFEASKQLAMTAISEIQKPKDKLNPPPLDPDLANLDQCGCSECASAVGPMAYLADLISFAFENIESNSDAIDTQWLNDNLFRDLTGIPIDCAELENSVCQARIATEVLQEMFTSTDINTIPTTVLEIYNARVIQYLVASYETILSKLGTSYDELRSYQTITDPISRERYAHRLGIGLDDPYNPGDTLSNMYKDVTTFTKDDITFLQYYFGLASTEANVETSTPFFELWKQERLRVVWAERDRKSTGYETGQNVIIDPDIVTVDDFRFFDADQTEYNVWKQRRAFVDAAYNDFASTEPTTSPEPTTRIEEMALLLEGSTGFTYSPIGGTPVHIGEIWDAESLDEISNLVTAISKGSKESKTTLFENYKLKADEAARLIEFYTIELMVNQELTLDEYIETYNICTQVVKRVFNAIWISEEEDKLIELSSQRFWISEREPIVGDWPIEMPITDPPTPLIDPQLISLNGLPEITFQTVEVVAVDVENSRTIYEERVTELEEIKAIVSGEEPNGVASYIYTMAEKVDYAFEGTTYEFNNEDTPPPDPKTFIFLNHQLNNPSESSTAQGVIQNTLKLTIENFVFIMEMAAKFGEDPVDLSQAESERLYSILVTSRKTFNKLDTWCNEEKLIPYWKLRKAQLPKWRASVTDRNEWKKAYIQHNEAPIIDADLIGPAYLVNPIDGNRAFDLWLERYKDMHANDGWYKELSEDILFKNPGVQNFANYKLLLDKYLMGDSGVSFYDTSVEREKTEVITSVLDQLLLTTSQFRFLLDVGKKLELAPGFDLSKDELDRIFYTLALVQKKKAYYRYKQEEADDSDVVITQSPDFFVSRDTDYYTYPPVVPYPLNHFLVSEQQLSAWRKIVSSRTNEEEKLKLDYKVMLLDTDDDSINLLRDALVEVLDNSNSSTSEKARKLGDRLLIDLQDNCCSRTNRVAMAIETMQQLVWKTYTGDIYSEYDLTLSVASFDTVWEWMGSYANWRASMFVFLYPENILLPSLKGASTPGFLNIINETQNNRNFNPGMACEIAEEYREYLADVSDLDLKTSVQTNVVTQKENKCGGVSQIIENLTFVFATAKNSGKSYYMTVKSTEESLSQRTFWANIPNIHEKAIIKGSDVYLNDDRGIHYLYVFYLVDAFDMRNKFFTIRYDLNKNEWLSDKDEYEIEKTDLRIKKAPDTSQEGNYDHFLENIKMDVIDFAVCENHHVWHAPVMAITLTTSVRIASTDREYNLTFIRAFGDDGLSFTDEGSYNKWLSFISGLTGRIKSLIFQQKEMSAPTPGWYGYNYFFHFKGSPDQEVNKVIRYYRDPNGTLRVEGLHLSQTIAPLFRLEHIIGTSPHGDIITIWGTTNSIFVYVTLDHLINGGNITIHTPQFQYNEKIKIGSFTKGHATNSLGIPFIYQLDSDDGQILFTAFTFDSNVKTMLFDDVVLKITPSFISKPTFDVKLTNSEIQMFREEGAENLMGNIDSSNPKLRIYAEEAYYFTPISIANKLSDNGYYSDALKWYRLVYDYFASEGDRKIYHGLVLEENYEHLQDRMAEWYEDPLNPHAIAATRQNAYTRFTIMSIGNTLLAYANAEFTKDNSESNPMARELYEDIIDLISVLDTAEPCAVDEKIRSLESYLNNTGNTDLKWTYKWQETFRSLRTLKTSPTQLEILVGDIQNELDGSGSEQVKFEAVQVAIETNRNSATTPTLIEKVEGLEYEVVSRVGLSMAGGQMEPLFISGKQAASENTNTNLRAITGFSREDLPTTNLDWLYTDSEAVQSRGLATNPVANAKPRTISEFYRREPKEGYNIANPFPEIRISGMSYLFCVAPNPTVNAILLTAHINLHKIHNCMNIAGMVRELSPFAAPTDATSGMPAIGAGGVLQLPGQSSIAPTNYRYGFLVERAKQMVSIAQQMESSMLQSLEKFDAESYAELKAEQDLELAKAGIKLQDLKVKEANSNKILAELQKERADIQVNGLQKMIDEGLLSFEDQIVGQYINLAILQSYFAQLSANSITFQSLLGAAQAATPWGAAAALVSAAGVAQIAYQEANIQDKIAFLNSNLAINNIYASLQRRQQEWNYQKTIASQDVKIGDQQIRIADDRIRITGQERAIAGIQQDQAEAVLNFLKTKFTNAELYEWMSGVLEDVYSHFLQEATAMSKLAEQQLAFERQVDLPKLIKSDYWNMATNTAMSIGASTSENDRKGLTGSARLLKDLNQLEQYAIDTNQRKLQITKVISLNEHDPVQMEMFRDSGTLRFTTSLRDFDWDYPGHYLRLIRRVSVTVIALTPPNKGIKATLINSGISSVVINTNNIFQKRIITRSPERIALSSPYNEYGMFQLDTNDVMYRPFEGSGVETLWELQMEKASNPFDYRSIADVLVTIEYDALENDLYSKTIKNQLNNEAKNESIVLSMRNDLPDEWYELMNPDADSGSTHFKIRKSDLAPNVLSNKLIAVKAYLSFDVDKLIKDGLITQDNDGKINVTTAIDGDLIISKDAEPGDKGMPLNNFLMSDLQNFESFPNIEQPIEGDWYVRLSQTTAVLDMIDKKQLRDIIIILEYSATKVEFSLKA